MKLPIRLTALAERRLHDIDAYFKSRGNSKKGRTTVHNVVKNLRKLGEHPMLGPKQTELDILGREYRFPVVSKTYKVLYRIEPTSVVVFEIFDVRQDPSRLSV